MNTRLIVLRGTLKVRDQAGNPVFLNEGDDVRYLSDKEIARLKADGTIGRRLADEGLEEPVKGEKVRDDGQLGQTTDPFGLDPDGLRGKSLQELNLLIRERDEKMPAAPDVETAIKVLSKDYRPTQP